MTEPSRSPESASNASLWAGLLLLIGGLIALVVLWWFVKKIFGLFMIVAILAGILFLVYWWKIGRKNDRPGPL